MNELMICYLIDLLNIALPLALKHIGECEIKAVDRLFESAVDRLHSISIDTNRQIHRVIDKNLHSSDKWTIFYKTKHQLNNRVRKI